MDTQKIADIDALILEEKRTIAREFFSDAWDAAITEGIDPQIIAEALIHGSLNQLAVAGGDDAANKAINDIRAMESEGEFLLNKTFQ